LCFVLAAASAQTYLPASELGLQLREEAGAIVVQGPQVDLAYLPGLGWLPPLPANLPPPRGQELPVEMLQAARLIQAPIAPVTVEDFSQFHGVRSKRSQTFVLTIPNWRGPSGFGFLHQLTLHVPRSLIGLDHLSLPEGLALQVFLGPQGTTLRFKAPPETFGYKSFVSSRGWSLQIFGPYPPKEETLAPGIFYEEVTVYAPEPLTLYAVRAEPRSWRLTLAGHPGQRALLPQLAPQALAILNGGYFDPATDTPIGLWVKHGVPLNFPYGRSALMWQGEEIFAGFPKFKTYVETQDHTRFPVGINLWKARLTALTLPGPAGFPGQPLLVVQGDRVLAETQGPYFLLPGEWALSYPPGTPPPALPGSILHLYTSLEPSLNEMLEAGPLLIQGGRYAFDPSAEPFRDPRVLTAITPQSAVAWTRSGELWLLVSGPSTPSRLAQGLLELGIWGAIRMDSGFSSQLWVEGHLRSPLLGSRPRRLVDGLALYPLTTP
jgi:hypothetical protein